MWILKRNHQHIKPETLTEYMDGRLEGGALARVDRLLVECEMCSDELGQLKEVVIRVRRLPVETPRRSFVMAAPPPELVRVQPRLRTSPPMRLPQWAFAGAASVAAIVLAVLVSADATGLLVPGAGMAVEVAPAAMSQAAPESAVAKADWQSLEMDGAMASTARPAATSLPADALVAESAIAEPSPAPLARAAAAAPEAGAPEIEAAAAEPPSAPEAMAFDAPEAVDAGVDSVLESAAAAPPSAPLANSTEAQADANAGIDSMMESAGAEPTPAPLGMLSDAPVADDAGVESPPSRVAAGVLDSGDQLVFESAEATSRPETRPLQEEVGIPVAGPVSSELPEFEQEGTAVFWRLMEVVLAMAVVLFLTGLAWKITMSRAEHG